MKNNILKALSILQSASLIGPQLALALPATGGSEGSAVAPEPLMSDTISATKAPTTGVMGGIELSKKPVTMDFHEADIRDVFRLLAIKSGLNMIYGADVTGTVTVHLDQVPFDQAFQTVLTLKGLVALPMGPKVIRIVTSVGLTTEQSQAATFTRVFRINYASAEDMKKPLDAIRSAAGRKGVSSVDTKTNSLIVTDTTEGLKEVEDLIPILDKKPQQVDIESKVVEVKLDNQTQTGISWAYASDLRKNGKGFLVGNTIDASGAGAGLQGTLDSGVAVVGPGVGGTGVDLNTIDSVGLSFLNVQQSYLLGAQIAALATKSRVKVLSTPHIVTTNNEEAKISVADKIPYQTTTLAGTGVSQTSVQFIEAGVKLSVKPTVNADRRITLKVKPEVSTAEGTSIANLPPRVNSRSAETTVVLRDGETIAIGGLIQEQIQKGVSGIPLLMDIPILGYLFKQTDNRKTRTELIIFLTPRIAGE